MSREQQLREALGRLRDVGDALRSTNLLRGREIHQLADDLTRLATPAPEPQGVRLTAEQCIAAYLKTQHLSNPLQIGMVIAQELNTALAASPATVAGAAPHKIKEIWLHTVADVLKNLHPGDDEDTVFQRDAAEAAIRELTGQAARQAEREAVLAELVKAGQAMRDSWDYGIPSQHAIPCEKWDQLIQQLSAPPARHSRPLREREIVTSFEKEYFDKLVPADYAPGQEALDGCICKGNWRKIVAETEPHIGQEFTDELGRNWRLFGIVHTEEDYYYGMSRVDSPGLALLSCVGSIEGHGYLLRSRHEKGSAA